MIFNRHMIQLNLVISRGFKRIGYGKFLSVSRYRIRKGLAPAPTANGPLIDDPDWSYPDGTPGRMTKGQTMRYLRDQQLGQFMVDYNKQFEEIKRRRLRKVE